MHALTAKFLGRNLGVSASIKCAQAGSSSHTRGLPPALFTTGSLQVPDVAGARPRNPVAKPFQTHQSGLYASFPRPDDFMIFAM